MWACARSTTSVHSCVALDAGRMQRCREQQLTTVALGCDNLVYLELAVHLTAERVCPSPMGWGPGSLRYHVVLTSLDPIVFLDPPEYAVMGVKRTVVETLSGRQACVPERAQMKCPEITQAANRSSGPTRPDNLVRAEYPKAQGPQGPRVPGLARGRVNQGRA